MGDSYRIKTELGINKSINVQLDQEFEFLEILSLKIQQTDIYTRSCADYGVLVGRVTANNGFGVPNARVSIFIPIEQVDESNPLITSIYPYKSPNDKNDDDIDIIYYLIHHHIQNTLQQGRYLQNRMF